MTTNSNGSYVFQGKIKIYSDGADRASLLEMNGNPKIAGLTMNPSLMRKAGVTDYRGYCKEILTHVTENPISYAVFCLKKKKNLHEY